MEMPSGEWREEPADGAEGKTERRIWFLEPKIDEEYTVDFFVRATLLF